MLLENALDIYGVKRRWIDEKPASRPQLPYFSTAKGMQTQPSSSHFGSLAVCFLQKLLHPMLYLLLTCMILDARGDVTVKSSVASYSNSQSLITTSAGWEWPRSAERPLPISTLTVGGHDGRGNEIHPIGGCDE